jgi:hypothetical protein
VVALRRAGIAELRPRQPHALPRLMTHAIARNAPARLAR